MRIGTKKTINKNNFTELINRKKYIFHVSSLKNIIEILNSGFLYSRHEITDKIPQNLANDNLINIRRKTLLPNGKAITSAIPFYFNPRQPMFNNLLNKKMINPYEIGAICLDIKKISQFDTWLYNANPIYPGAKYIGSCNDIDQLNWDIIGDWNWETTNLPDIELVNISQIRQSELLISQKISTELIEYIIVDLSKSMPNFPYLNTLIVPTIFSDLLPQKTYS
jgi:hypothetical protein